MKNLIFTLSILISSISSLFGQGYDEILTFGVYQNDLALVQKEGLYGFIDSNGTEIVAPKYDEIFTFGVYQNDLALVQKDGLYGFINTEGVEVIPAKNKEIPVNK
tara:strand:+ start:1100 stop:1414 length:315 start_codon:yes stop_codon:yes gene_type:complete